MDERELMYDAFSICSVINGEIKFLKNYSKEELMVIYNKFSADLLDYKIPHYRVVGVLTCKEVKSMDSVIRIIPHYGISKLTLMRESQRIIPVQFGGSDIEKGCFLNEDEPSKRGELGWDAMNSGDANILRRVVNKKDKSKWYGTREQIGQLWHYPEMFGYELSTDNIYFNQINPENVERPRFLLKHKLGEIKSVANGERTFSTWFFYYKGTGYMDFKQTQVLFTENSGVSGCRVKFDLSEFFTCRIPQDGGDSLTLTILEDIDELALTTILRDYGKGFGV